MKIRSILLTATLLLFPGFAFAAPTITGISGTITNGQTVSVSGSGFGTKTAAAPVAFGDMENNSLNARIGSWSSTHNIDSVSSSFQRNTHSAHSAYCNVRRDVVNVGDDFDCAFSGGSDAPQWYAQYWFYTEPGFSWSSGPNANQNNKIFRMWSAGSNLNNLRIQSANHVDVVVEAADEGHGGWGTGWQPVTAQYACADAAFGHPCITDYWSIYPGSTQWTNFETDMGPGVWHQFQFEMKSSSVDTPNGVLRWWVDGKLIFDHSDITTRTASNPSNMRPLILGIEAIHNSGGDGAIGHYYLDDAYIDNTWQRVEIGNNATYNNCTLKEIQPATAWADGSISFTVNQGSFADGSTGYVFVTDANGTRNTGYQVTFGASGGGDTTPPAAPTGLAVS